MIKYISVNKTDNEYIVHDRNRNEYIYYDDFNTALNLARMRLGKTLNEEKVYKIPFINKWIVL